MSSHTNGQFKTPHEKEIQLFLLTDVPMAALQTCSDPSDPSESQPDETSQKLFFGMAARKSRET